ncbi:MAG: cytochrome c-type biogenesis protein [Actinomycetota bacterium]
MTRLGILVICLVMFATPAYADAQDVANDISNEVMSPFCDGVTLHDCGSRAAIELRAEIEGWAAAGWSRDRIMDELVSRYGEDIRGAPSFWGRGFLAWALPIAAVIAGGLLAWWLASRWSHRPHPSDATTDISDEDRRRLDAELRVYRSEA